MDAGAIPGITANVDRAAAHGIAHGIADASAHDDFAVIHGVPDGILCVSDNIDAPAAEICAECIARNALNRDVFSLHSGCDKSLSEASCDAAFTARLPYFFIQCGKMQAVCFNNHFIIPHFPADFYGNLHQKQKNSAIFLYFQNQAH
mgnify:CR=1 FL=1